MNYKFVCCVMLFFTFSARASEYTQNVIDKNVLVSIQRQACGTDRADTPFESYEMIGMQKSKIEKLDGKYNIILLDDNKDGSIDMYSLGWMQRVPHPCLFTINVKINSDVSRDFVQQFKSIYDVCKNNCTSDDVFHVHFKNKQTPSNDHDIILIFSKQQAEQIAAITPKPSPSTIAPMLINVVSGALLTALVYLWIINIE